MIKILKYIGSFLKKHWYKLMLVIFAVGLAFPGYKCACGDKTFEKTEIKFRK